MAVTERIGQQQLTWLTANGLLGASILFLPSLLINTARQNAWITAIVTLPLGLALCNVWVSLSLRFPRKSLVEVCTNVFGLWLGRLVVLPVLAYLLWLCAVMLRELVDFFAVYYVQTPEEFMAVVVILVSLYVVLGGLEVIARLNDLVFPIVVLGITLIVIPGIFGSSWQGLTPILDQGWRPILQGVFLHISFPYGDAIAFMMVFPHIRETKTLRKSVIAGALIGFTIFLFSTLITIVSLGAAHASRTVYPLHMSALLIQAGVFNRLDGVVAVTWTLSNFMRFVLWLYALTLGLSHWFRLLSYKTMVIPSGALVAICSLVVFTSFPEQITLVIKIYPYLAPIAYLAVPLLCWVVAVITAKPAKPLVADYTEQVK